MFDFIQSLLTYELPPKDSMEYRDIVFNCFLILLGIIVFFAFFKDVKNQITKMFK